LALAADHGGYALKADVAAAARALGWEVLDLGTHSPAPVDYPDFAARAAELVASGQARLGVVIDAAGLGSAIAANKVTGVRAAPCSSVELARSAREHNFANVLALGARFLDRARAVAITEAFLGTATGEERHARRVAKIAALERRHSRGLAEDRR
jgi:ribose 5-phosphate isomerase B